MKVHADRFAHEDAKLARLEQKVHYISDRLEAILERTALRMTMQEQHAVERVQHLEETVKKLTTS